MNNHDSKDAPRDPTTRIRRAILAGDFFPNERLVETDLAVRFDGTRASIRLALAVLEQQGLVIRERNRGARVRLVSESEAIEIAEIRARLEALIARHAALRVTPADLTLLEDMLRAMEAQAAAGRLDEYSASNLAFHAELARIAQLPATARILTSLQFQTVVFQFRPIFEPGRAAAVDAEHRVLVAALAAGDGDAAESAMHQHLRNVKDALEAAIAARRIERRFRLAADDPVARAAHQEV
ncbi:MAG TPA: GntR family transcriptional regulator [Stellaceae bacterium]|jgi:DNA-binding GntR family transcriptional regulator|nr:GntR family transcriptional regulator [Stellaceae bacterium]